MLTIIDCWNCRLNLCKVISGLDLINSKSLIIFIKQCPAIDLSGTNDSRLVFTTNYDMIIIEMNCIGNVFKINNNLFRLNSSLFASQKKLFQYDAMLECLT